ncbi:hypothetical protein [Paractinoplanes rishiriensis]|uniref:Uncharacterized protein n=1 Tax=Paractinoplanes rishiriensis TaxID=1050105 RepID=A0A919K263_9ACTN|nr:hypothetical protein [Actinoplanes rishiriensis]GIE99315.1 hypothetical protein Ari01nite_67800 [Actinoplanes rishiriensis]
MTLVRAIVLAAATVATWAAWLSWETGYRTDADGAVSGPYSWWQVAGCVLTLAVVTAVAGRFLPLLVVVPVVAISFTAAWSVQAASADESGLWPVGAFLVLLGTAVGAAVVAGAVKLVTGRGFAS